MEDVYAGIVFMFLGFIDAIQDRAEGKAWCWHLTL
jgi:hypothetical protein